MTSEYRTQRRVEFVDTDTAGIVHFSNFFRYMESAEHEFIRSLGEELHKHDGRRMTGFARVHAECDYSSPLRYGELFEITLRVVEKRTSILVYSFEFTRVSDGESVAKGGLTVCCVTGVPGVEEMHAAPIPDAIATRID